MTESLQFAGLLCLYKNNDAQEVEDALHSTFKDQTVPPSQLIAVFDGPVPDEVEQVISRFEQNVPTIRIVFPTNQGHGPARAAGIDACTFPWVAIIDADDISLPHRFEVLCSAIQHDPETAVIGGALQEFVETPAGRHILNTRTYPQKPADVRAYLQNRSPIAQPTAMLRIAAIRDVGNYQSWFNNEDYHLWIRLVHAGYTLRNIAEPVLFFRTNPDLYHRRGGIRYWWNEVALQRFSLQQGTTTYRQFALGATARFVVQVLMPNRMRRFFYTKILRRE